MWHETGGEKRERTTARAMALASTTTRTMARGGSVAGTKSTATPNQNTKKSPHKVAHAGHEKKNSLLAFSSERGSEPNDRPDDCLRRRVELLTSPSTIKQKQRVTKSSTHSGAEQDRCSPI
jgi:hypothetical protein